MLAALGRTTQRDGREPEEMATMATQSDGTKQVISHATPNGAFADLCERHGDAETILRHVGADYGGVRQGLHRGYCAECERQATKHESGDACECGKVTGERCKLVRRPEDMVTVETMPEHLRESHRAAGNSGRWPQNGAELLQCSRGCADSLVEADPEWASIVE